MASPQQLWTKPAGQSLACREQSWRFEINVEDKAMLLHGIDAVELTLKSAAEIDQWNLADRALRPWAHLETLK